MKKYNRPEIGEETLELEDIIAESSTLGGPQAGDVNLPFDPGK